MPSKVINSAFLALTFTKCYTIVPCYLGGGGGVQDPLPSPKMDAWYCGYYPTLYVLCFFLKCIHLMKFNL